MSSKLQKVCICCKRQCDNDAHYCQSCGYKFNIVDKCPCCLVVKPLEITLCGHIVCKGCVLKGISCPTCNKDIKQIHQLLFSDKSNITVKIPDLQKQAEPEHAETECKQKPVRYIRPKIVESVPYYSSEDEQSPKSPKSPSEKDCDELEDQVYLGAFHCPKCGIEPITMYDAKKSGSKSTRTYYKCICGGHGRLKQKFFY